MNSDKTVFSNSFFGYDKKSVNDFILKMDRDFARQNDEQSEQIRILKSQVDEKNRQIDDVRRYIGSLQSELKAKNEANEELYSRISSLEKDLSDVQFRADEASAELNSEIERLRDEIDTVKEERDSLSDEMKLIEETKINGFDKELNDYRDSVSVVLRELTKKCLKEIVGGVNGIKNDLSVMSETTEYRTDRMMESIDSYEEEMKNEIRRILDGFSSEK
jgi:chromosome segregation ATPase